MGGIRRHGQGLGDDVALIHGAVRRSVIGRIQDWRDAATPSSALYDVQVEQALPPEPERVTVYGGRLAWTRAEVLAERNVAHTMTITYDVRVRVVELGDDIASAEARADAIEDAVTRAIQADPPLAGGSGRVVVTSGDADPVVIGIGGDGFTAVTVNRGITVTVTITAAGV